MSDTDNKSITNGCALVLVQPIYALWGGIIFTASSLLDAYVATQMWTWFVQDYATLAGVATPPFAFWVGLDALVSLIVKPRRSAPKDPSKTALDAWSDLLLSSFVYPTAILIAGYLLAHWILGVA